MDKVSMKATDACDLERKIMDINVAKSESEWWACHEIAQLRKDLAGMVQANAEQFELRTQDHEEILSLRVALAERKAEIKELKAQLPNRNRHSVMVISELRAALVEAVDALEVVCKYDREERNQPYEDGELAFTRCKEVLRK